MARFQNKQVTQAAVTKQQMLLATAALLVIVLAAYGNTFHCPFIFDDVYSIEDNMSIREWRTALTPDLKIGETASGRPVLNLTLAINYKISGLDVWSYHAGNLLIHFLAGLALFGVVRRTLLLPALRERFGQNAFMLGWLVAAIWLAHPLATESVTYITDVTRRVGPDFVSGRELLCGLLRMRGLTQGQALQNPAVRVTSVI
ncbi:MAG: hypothetical protein LBM04_05260 [Opitutaceae bacterium]|jgi:hypothetical protein|nr:hypothetical protein [Opitutaceae bacterium]